MAYRSDIVDGYLVYTCNCGWIDKGHANGIAAKNLWKDLLNEADKYRQNGIEGFKVPFAETTAKFGITFNKQSQDFFVKKNLSNVEKEQVALAIFQEVSLGFEKQQLSSGIKGFFVENFGPASGFSEEDLVSNIVGFYDSIRGSSWKSLCNPVKNIQTSLDIWDRDGAVGWNKNYTFLPKFHKCDECSETPSFPFEYQTIQPSQKGVLHFDFEPNSAMHIIGESQRLFQRNLFSGDYISGFGYRTIPKEITIPVGTNESSYYFARRALIQAAFVMQLPLWERLDFADTFFPLNVDPKVIADFKLNWTGGDPSNDKDSKVKTSDFKAIRGEHLTYTLSVKQYNELRKRKENYIYNSPQRFFPTNR